MLKIKELQRKKREEAEAQAALKLNAAANTALFSPCLNQTRVSAAQIRLQKDIAELDLPPSIQVRFPDPQDLFHFTLEISPQQGYYKSGQFRFAVEIGQNFPIDPPKIKCLDTIYHPNIDLDGNVCLNILRQDWLPVLNMNLIFIGLNFLLLEPNANDPLNKDAANVLVKDISQFRRNVLSAMAGSYVDGHYYDYVLRK